LLAVRLMAPLQYPIPIPANRHAGAIHYPTHSHALFVISLVDRSKTNCTRLALRKTRIQLAWSQEQLEERLSRQLLMTPKISDAWIETGLLIRKFRRELAWTQESLEQESGVAVGSIKNVESGRPISPTSHHNIVKALNRGRQLLEVPKPLVVIPFPDTIGLTVQEHQGRHGGRRSGDSPTPYEQAMGSLDEVMSPWHKKAKLALLRIQTLESLREVWHLDQESYPEYNFTFEKLKRLWDAYPEGLYGVYRDDQFRGAMGIWPVTKEWADGMKAAQIREETFEPEIVSKAATERADHWYITGIVIQPAVQGTALAKFFLEKRIGAWIKNRNAVFPSEFLALGFSNRGQAILRNFGFELLRHGPEMPDLLPLYRLGIPNVEDLRARLRNRGLEL